MFDINIHCVVFGVSEPLNKRCILSTNKDDLQLPYFKLEDADKNQINRTITNFLKQFICVNELVLIPQIITLNAKDLNQDTGNILDIVYGFIIDYNSSIDDDKVFWVDFKPMADHKLVSIVLETMQKLR